MTERQKIELKLSETRKALNALGSKPELTEEDKTEFERLKSEYGNLEVRFQALTIAEVPEEKTETSEKPEAREKRQLIEKCNLGSIFESVVEQRQTDGPEAELQKELKLAADQVPLALLEKRAVTPVPDTVKGTTQAEILPYIFPDSLSAFLSVSQPTVPVGNRRYPILKTPAAPGTPAKGAAQAETTGAFEAVDLKPARIQASFFYNIEDRASFVGLDEALRMNLSDALSDKLDAQVIANLIADGNEVDKSSALADYQTFVDMVYEGVDGRIVNDTPEIRVVLGSDAFVLASKQFSDSTTTIGPTALSRMKAESGGVRVGAHIPAQASKKQKQIVRRGMRMDAVAPIWEGIQIIEDRVTKAGNGQIVLTAVMLYAVDTLRDTGFNIVELQLSA